MEIKVMIHENRLKLIYTPIVIRTLPLTKQHGQGGPYKGNFNPDTRIQVVDTVKG